LSKFDPKDSDQHSLSKLLPRSVDTGVGLAFAEGLEDRKRRRWQGGERDSLDLQTADVSTTILGTYWGA
jgi:hypothetical protein